MKCSKGPVRFPLVKRKQWSIISHFFCLFYPLEVVYFQPFDVQTQRTGRRKMASNNKLQRYITSAALFFCK